MSDSKYGFATQILTSKSPYEAAAIVPHVLNTNEIIVRKQLNSWFQNYTTEFQRHNAELYKLLNEGAAILGITQETGNPRNSHSLKQNSGSNISTTPEDLGTFNKIWNTFLRSVELEVKANDHYIKSLKGETLTPLKNFATNDVRSSELLVNSQELQEIASNLQHNQKDAEYHWNAKAPQIFDNLENFENAKSGLLFDIILNYFNSQTTRFSKQTSNSENSVNYLLGTYNVEDEMKSYLKYLISNDFTHELASLNTSKSSMTATASQKRMSKFGHIQNNSNTPHNHNSDAHSLHSANTATSPSKKKSSKLKSKVGSIFGRKSKKSSKFDNKAETIDETESIASSTTHSTQNGIKSSGSLSQRRKSGVFKQPQNASESINTSKQQDFVTHHNSESNNEEQPASKNTTAGINSDVGASHAPKPTISSIPLTPKPKEQAYAQNQQDQQQGHSPNVVKYDESSSDEDEEIPMLRQHHLDKIPVQNEPKSKELSVPTTNTRPGLSAISTSASKYSFETGDEDKQIDASSPGEQRPTSKVLNENLPDFNANAKILQNDDANTNTSVRANSVASNGVSRNNSTGVHHQAPPPPPSRKVVHKQSENVFGDGNSVSTSHSINRNEIKSHHFQNLSNARDSIVAPRKLVSQNTGTSSIRHLTSAADLFKHSDEEQKPGLNASIAEVINVSFKNDQLIRKQLIGEIAFSYIPEHESNEHLKPLLVTIPHKFDKTILNSQFFNHSSNSESEFVIDTSKIVSKTLGAFKYLKTIDVVPILVHQVWKFEEHQASLMVSLKLNPDYGSSLDLNNFVVNASLSQDSEATSAASKPPGTFNHEHNRITWRLNSVSFDSESNHTLIARFQTNGKASESESGIQLNFSVVKPPVNTEVYLDGVSVPSVRSLVSGVYSGHS